MNNTTLLLNSIFIISFNIIFFISSGFTHNASTWISYCFIHLAYVMVIISSSIHFTRKEIILKISLNVISLAYFFIEFIVGLIIIFFTFNNTKFSIIIQFSIFCIYLLIFIINIFANQHTNINEIEYENNILYYKSLKNKIKDLLNTSNSIEINNKLNNLYDEICSSQVKSSLSMKTLEEEIMIQVDLLEKSILYESKEEILINIYSISKLVIKRNKELMLSN